MLLFEISDLYGEEIEVIPEEQLAIYASATGQALAEGYTGLRVSAKVTELVAKPDAWETHVRWESLADRYMASRPLAALCGSELGFVDRHGLQALAARTSAAGDDPRVSVRGVPEALGKLCDLLELRL